MRQDISRHRAPSTPPQTAPGDLSARKDNSAISMLGFGAKTNKPFSSEQMLTRALSDKMVMHWIRGCLLAGGCCLERRFGRMGAAPRFAVVAQAVPMLQV